jgi:polysaccharide deacetylase family protein (PEP-CTERM system associated)
MTVDVEDYYQVSAFDRYISRRQWDQYPSRVVENTRRVLRLFAGHDVRATFFILGWVGHRFPGLVREIAEAGHEVGCHSYWHRLIYLQTPTQFRDDLRQARDVLQDATGRPVTAYRAPSWSITAQSQWALEILAEEDFAYDSSIFPIYHDRYGMPNINPYPHQMNLGGGKLWEFPPSVIRCAGVNIPVSGGGYFRFYPVAWSTYALRRVNRRADQPFLFYIHPWELDPDQPRIAANWRARWRHYINLSTTEKKLDRLLSQFQFGCLTEVLQRADSTVTHFVPGAPGALSSR